MSLPSLNELNADLSNAIKHETTYKQKNDAKFRACAQMGGYDQFKDMVAASHLKPVDLRRQPLNELSKRSVATELGIASSGPVNPVPVTPVTDEPSSLSILPASLLRPPRTAHEFERDWERYCKTLDQKYSYLVLLEGSEVSRIFRRSLGLDTVSEIVQAIGGYFKTQEAEGARFIDAMEMKRIFQLLGGLASCDRFKLSASCFGNKDKTAIQVIFGRFNGASRGTRHPEDVPIPRDPESAPESPLVRDEEPLEKGLENLTLDNEIRKESPKNFEGQDQSYPMMSHDSEWAAILGEAHKSSPAILADEPTSSSQMLKTNTFKKAPQMSKYLTLPFTAAGVSELLAVYEQESSAY